MLNLSVNARDAMDRGGKLTISTANIEIGEQDAVAGGPPPGRYARLSIADTGHGIAPNDAARIFEPFFTTKKDSGTGLGLWLSYNIVQKHGGSIRLRSRVAPGKCGTVFRVFLPSIAQPSLTAPSLSR